MATDVVTFIDDVSSVEMGSTFYVLRLHGEIKRKQSTHPPDQGRGTPPGLLITQYLFFPTIRAGFAKHPALLPVD